MPSSGPPHGAPPHGTPPGPPSDPRSGPLCPPGRPPFDILRIGHVELGVTDLDRASAFYVDALGFVCTERTGDHMYLRGLEDRGHHCLVLSRSEVALCKRVGYRVRDDEDLDRAAAYFEAQGLEHAWVDAHGQGRTLHARDPFGVPLAFYERQEPVERLLQRYDLYHGASPQRLDHLNAFAADLQGTHEFYTGALGFRVSEYTYTDEAEPRLWAVWMHRKGNVHDLALTNGRGPRLHHVGVWTRGEMDILHACDALASSGWLANMERGPGRHGISNAFFLYLRDPDGHRVELFTGDYRTLDSDFEPIGWTLDDPRRQTLWGHPAPRSWFEEGTPFEGVPVVEPLLEARPVVAM